MSECKICRWPLPDGDTTGWVCPCCGFEPGFDNAADYHWNGRWWSELVPPPAIVDALRAELPNVFEEIGFSPDTARGMAALSDKLIAKDAEIAALRAEVAQGKIAQDALVESFYDPDPVHPDPELDYSRVDWRGVVQAAKRQLDVLRAEVETLEAERNDFYMAYRSTCDVQTRAALREQIKGRCAID